jgi:regulatory protein YycH of two-component signal transduction system YycFG
MAKKKNGVTLKDLLKQSDEVNRMISEKKDLSAKEIGHIVLKYHLNDYKDYDMNKLKSDVNRIIG